MTSLHKISSICTSCAEGCGVYTQVEQGKILQLEYMLDHPVNNGSLCLKGNRLLDNIHHPQRLYSPLAKKDDGTFEPISWEEAIDTASSQLKKIARKYGPDSLAFLTSAHCTNEECYLFQKLAKVVGTNNIDSTSFYEGNYHVEALIPALGYAAITNPFSDLSNAECIVISGSAFLENHPIVSRWIFEAKSKGATIICLDHRVPTSLLFCDHFLQINPGTQAIFIDGMITHILDKQIFNAQFIEERTSGFKAFQKAMGKQSLKNCEQVCGIPAHRIKEIAECYATANAAALVQSNDFGPLYGKHTHTTHNLINLALLCGHIGRPGTGVFPLPQSSNVQGSYDMGISPRSLPGQISLKDKEQHGRLAKLWKLKSLPLKEGLAFPEMAKPPKNRRIRALYIMESNPLGESIFADQFKKTLGGVEFILVQDCFLTETAREADIVLPASSWAEKTGTYTSAERRVQWQSKILNPQKHIMPNWQVICSIAKKLGLKNQFSFGNPEMILKEINKAVADYAGISTTRLKKMHGIINPCPTAKHPGTSILYTEGFATSDGRGKFIPPTYDRKAEKPSKKYPFHLNFCKTIPALKNTLNGEESSASIQPPPVPLVEINPKDAKKISIQNLSEIKIITRLGSVKATARITEKVLPGVVSVPFLPADNQYPLSGRDPRAAIPELNATTCDIKKSGGKKGE